MTDLNPYVAPKAELDHEFDSDEIVLAELGERIFARLIDWFLRGVIFIILLVVSSPVLVLWLASVWGAEFNPGEAPDPNLIMWFIFVNFNNPLILYLILITHISFLLLQAIPLALWGQTIGKKLLNIAMVDAESYERVPFFKLLFLRYFVWDIPALFFGPLNWLIRLTDLCFGFQNDRRTLHDKLANTVVIKA